MIGAGPRQEEILVTGAGLHGAFGGVAETLAALGEGQGAIRPVVPDAVDDFEAAPAAAAATFDPFEQLADRKLRKYMNPVTELAVLSAGRALAQAGLNGDAGLRAEMDLYVATGLIAFDLSQLTPLHGEGTTPDGRLDLQRMGERGIRACHPLLPFKMLLNMPLGLVSIVHGLKGENFILYPGAEQAAVCLEKAARSVRLGRAKRVLVGGSAHQISLLPLASMRRQDRLAPSVGDACRTSAAARGLAPADAGAFLVLESGRAARARKAPILARVESVSQARSAEALWQEAATLAQPDAVWSTGDPDLAAELRAEALSASIWPARSIAFRRPDRQLGHAGPAALPATLALACCDRSTGRRVAVLSHGEDGRAALVMLSLDPESGGAA